MKFKYLALLVGLVFIPLSTYGVGILNHISASLVIEKDVTVVSYDKNLFSLKLNDERVITFGCGGVSDTLTWPGLKKDINDVPVYNLMGFFPHLTNEVGPLARMDFYCDTFSGKEDEEKYQVYKRLTDSLGKTLKMKINVITSVVRISDKRSEIVMVSGIDFSNENGIVASFVGRPSERESKSFANFSSESN